MHPLATLQRRRLVRLWGDPVRRVATLTSFAATEEDGGRDLEAAARRITDPFLREHVLRHAADERRHAALFRTRAAELSARAAAAGGERADRPYDLARARNQAGVDAHGFFRAGLYDELGEVSYVAMLHVAEQRAKELFERHRDALGGDPETRSVFESILVDEKYHVAYTAKVLERWRAAGRGQEVDEALAQARHSRVRGAWKRLGLRSAAGFGRALLWVLYWTLLQPFAWYARRRAPATGWRPPQASRPEAQA